MSIPKEWSINKNGKIFYNNAWRDVEYIEGNINEIKRSNPTIKIDAKINAARKQREKNKQETKPKTNQLTKKGNTGTLINKNTNTSLKKKIYQATDSLQQLKPIDQNTFSKINVFNFFKTAEADVTIKKDFSGYKTILEVTNHVDNTNYEILDIGIELANNHMKKYGYFYSMNLETFLNKARLIKITKEPFFPKEYYEHIMNYKVPTQYFSSITNPKQNWWTTYLTKPIYETLLREGFGDLWFATFEGIVSSSIGNSNRIEEEEQPLNFRDNEETMPEKEENVKDLGKVKLQPSVGDLAINRDNVFTDSNIAKYINKKINVRLKCTIYTPYKVASGEMIAVGNGMFNDPSTFSQSCMTYAFRAAAGNLFYRNSTIRVNGKKGINNTDRIKEISNMPIININSGSNGAKAFTLNPNYVEQFKDVDEYDDTVFINSDKGLEQTLLVYNPTKLLLSNSNILEEKPEIIKNLMNITDPDEKMREMERIINNHNLLQYPNDNQEENRNEEVKMEPEDPEHFHTDMETPD